MSDSPKQVAFQLRAVDPMGDSWFVSHSGVALAEQELLSALVELAGQLGDRSVIDQAGPEGSGVGAQFLGYKLVGPEGVGKTHLLNLIGREAESRGIRFSQVDGLLGVGEFVARYEAAKKEGGLFVFACRPEDVAEDNKALDSPYSTESNQHFGLSNPHLRSRLNTLVSLRMTYPLEEELLPVFESLAERFNFKIPQSGIDYLLKRLPLKPLSFNNILAKLDDFCLAEGKKAGRGALRDLLQEKGA